MGNEQSVKQTLTAEQMEMYQQQYIVMQQTISKQESEIRMLRTDKEQYYRTIEDLRKTIQEKEWKIKANEDEINRKQAEIEQNEMKVKSKDTEISKLKAEVAKNKRQGKNDKYKSMPEFEAILRLNKDLVDFQEKIESVIARNCDLLLVNDEEQEIEKIKRKNAELYGQLKSANITSTVLEKSMGLKEAESELSAKKEVARQEFLKINGKLMMVKDKMSQATKKFAVTVESSMIEIQKNFQGFKKEVATLEASNQKVNEGLSYDKIKNILLQQQNTLMHELMDANIPINVKTVPPPQQNPPVRKIHNNLNNFNNPNNTKQKNINPDDIKKNNYLSPKNLAEHDKDNNDFVVSSDSENYSIYDDDASETSSIAGKPKTYKIILLNVHEEGNRPDEEKVKKVLRELTSQPLDDIDVRRVGKPTGKARPVIVAFDSFRYVDEILKMQHKLKQTKFDMIKVCPYKSKPQSNFNRGRGGKAGGRGGQTYRRGGHNQNNQQKKDFQGPI